MATLDSTRFAKWSITYVLDSPRGSTFSFGRLNSPRRAVFTYAASLESPRKSTFAYTNRLFQAIFRPSEV